MSVPARGGWSAGWSHGPEPVIRIGGEDRGETAGGGIWAANNWNLPKAAMASSPDPRFSTWGGGSGLTVIYGAAAPVKPPRIGVVKGY